jgi:ABC-type glycerol-3-phosphate transport system permease component
LKGSGITKPAAFVLLGAFGLAFVFVFGMLVAVTLKDPGATRDYGPFSLGRPTLANYAAAWRATPWLHAFANTLLIAGLGVVGQVLSSSLVAFGLARIDFRGRRALFALVVATLFVPMQVTLVPLYVLFSKMGWVDTFLPLVVPQFFAGAFNVFLLRQFYLTIPTELDDAARVDGATWFGVWWRVVLPLSKPPLVLVGLFTFIWNWKDLLGQLIYLNSPSRITVARALWQLLTPTEDNWNVITSSAVMALVPLVVVFSLAARWLIKGISIAGVRR